MAPSSPPLAIFFFLNKKIYLFKTFKFVKKKKKTFSFITLVPSKNLLQSRPPKLTSYFHPCLAPPTTW
jgi:hypothetical protein